MQEEGVRIWTNVIDRAPDEVKIGDAVVLVHDDVTDEITLPKLRRVEDRPG